MHNQKRLTVHHDIITKRSVLLRRLKPDLGAVSRSEPVNFSELEPETFTLYLHCIYCDVVPDTLEDDDDEEANDGREPHADQWKRSQAKADKRFMALVELCILADKLEDVLTVNMVINEIKSFGSSCGYQPSASVIDLAFESTVENDGLRRLLVYFYVLDAELISKGDWPSEFLRLVVYDLLMYKSQDKRLGDGTYLHGDFNVKNNGSCYYHYRNEEHPHEERRDFQRVMEKD